jgi:glutathione S-transferase
MKLYYKPGSASFVVHWLLLELGAPFELQLFDLSTGEQRSPAYLKLNPNGTVPTLEVDGEVYYETAAILLWLADRDPKQRFAPAINEYAARGHYLKWMLHLANTYMPAKKLLRRAWRAFWIDWIRIWLPTVLICWATVLLQQTCTCACSCAGRAICRDRRPTGRPWRAMPDFCARGRALSCSTSASN